MADIYTVGVGERIRGGATRHHFPMAHEDAQRLALLLPSLVLPAKVQSIWLTGPTGAELYCCVPPAGNLLPQWPNPEFEPASSDLSAFQFVIVERGDAHRTDRPWQFSIPEATGRELATLLHRTVDHKRVLWMGLYDPAGERMTVEVGPTGRACITIIPQSATDAENAMLDQMDRAEEWRISRAEEAVTD